MTAENSSFLSSIRHETHTERSRRATTIALIESAPFPVQGFFYPKETARGRPQPAHRKMKIPELTNEVKIRAEHVDFSYEKTQTLFDINLEFRNHEVTALIGPSGCGKSTFLRTLSRMNELICPTTLKGRIELDGDDIYAKNYDVVELRQRVGMVFQKPTPFPKSIYENVAYGLRVAGITSRSILDEKVEESLRRAALWDEVKDRLNESALGLSGGQQQRLCIARALAVEPEVLLMDEPCSTLDPIATQRVEESILALKNSLCIVIVTHNMQQAARVSDKTAFFFMGKLIEFDKTDTIFNNAANVRTRDYVNGRFG